MIQNNLFTKQKGIHRLKEETCGCLGGRMGGRDSEGVWDGHAHTVVFKMDNRQRPTVH